VRTPSLLTKTGALLDISISHIENGTQAFYVQLSFNNSLLTGISNMLNQLPLKPLAFIREGVVCAFKHKEGVSRCLVVSSSHPCRVRLVDSGIVANVDHTDLYELPSHFFAVGQLAHPFCLSGVLSNQNLYNNPKVIERFKTLSRENRQLKLKVVEADGPPTVQYCELFLNRKSVVDLLNDEATPRKYIHHQLLANTKYEVMVSHVETKSQQLPWHIFVQYRRNRIESFSLTLKNHCESTVAPVPSQLQENAPILAKYGVGGWWYRGMLLKIAAAKATVYFVDYGKTEEIILTDLRLPTRNIVEVVPAQAFKCLMDGVSFNQAASLSMDSRCCGKVGLHKMLFGCILVDDSLFVCYFPGF